MKKLLVLCLGAFALLAFFAAMPQNAAATSLTVSGRVTKCGQGVAGVAVETCGLGTVYTDASGYWSASAYKGQSYCARLSNVNGVRSNTPCDATSATYEWQVAGENKFTSCSSSESGSWDRSSDSNVDFWVDDVTGIVKQTGGNGLPAVFVVTNNSGCSAKITAATYKVFVQPYETGWDNQEVFSYETIIVPNGDTRQITLDTPDCLAQVDVYTGELVYPNTIPGPSFRLLDFAFSNDKNLCSKCTNECSTNGQRVCSGNGWKQCGNYDSDSCLEWGSVTQCGWNQTCVNGSCINTDTCQNQCLLSQHECSGSSGRTCVQSGQCTAWGTWQTCDSRCYSCGDGRCECGETKASCPQDCGYNTPTVNLDYSGQVKCGQNATLHWTSNNATNCQAGGSWSGSKATSGSEQVGNFTGSRTYTITCTGSGGSASDSVSITGTADDLEADAGPDKYINDNESSVRLDGSVDGNYDSLSWSCTGGSLSSSSSLRPTFYRPDYNYNYNDNSWDYDKTYTCTLTARNECGSDSDTMKVRVERDDDDQDFNVSLIARPKSDCAPLENVDLIATVSNYGSSNYDRDFTYYFDCENDGHWDKTVTTDNTSYTAVNLCDYRNVGSYTARVRVERQNRTATDTEIVRAEQCGKTATGDLSITKTVSNLSLGTGYQGTVSANPLNTVAYRIVVAGITGTANNVTLTDAVPAGITNIRDLRVDGIATNGSLSSGISLGTIVSGQTKTITYTATVANDASFVYGQTTLTNVATVTADGKSADSRAAVTVNRRAVMGATAISTGFDNQTLAGLGLGLAAAILCLAWVAKTQIIDPKRDPRQILREKIAAIRKGM